MRKISILGSGSVGITVGKGLKKLGNKVIFYDIDGKVVQELRDSGFDATADIAHIVRESDISFLCVPTQTKKIKKLT